MSGDFEKSAPPNDIFVTIIQNPLPNLPLRINAVCSEHPDYVVHSITKLNPIIKQRSPVVNKKSLLLHLRRMTETSEDVSELRKKVDILVRMLSFMPDVAGRIRDAKIGRYEVPEDWDDDLRNLFG